MNRILQADVILTLTAADASRVVYGLNLLAIASESEQRDACIALSELVERQCIKQGVQP